MATTPRWAQGADVSAFVLTPQTCSAAGVFADTTPTMAFAGFWKRWKLSGKKQTEEASASDSPRDNNIVISVGSEFEVDFFIPNTTASTCDALNSYYATADYFKYAVKAGGAGHTTTGYGVLIEFDLEFDGKGAGKGSMRFAMADTGSANPVVS